MSEWNIEEASKTALAIQPPQFKTAGPNISRSVAVKVVKLINHCGKPLHSTQIVVPLGIDAKRLPGFLSPRLKKGEILRVGRGWYSTPEVEAKLKEQTNDTE